MQTCTTPVILSVDDSEQALGLRAAVLQLHGYAVLSSRSTRQAIALLETNRVDAIITDYEMPEENGLEFARRVRQRGYTLPIILHSGSASDSSLIDHSISGFVPKGEPITSLLGGLVALLSGWRSNRISADPGSQPLAA